MEFCWLHTHNKDTIIQLHTNHITHRLYHITAFCRLMWYFLQTNTSYSNMWSWPSLWSQLPVMVGHTFMELERSMILYMAVTVYGSYCTWLLLHTLATCLSLNHGQSFTFPVMIFVYVQPSYVGKPEELYSSCIIWYIRWNLHLLEELLVVHSTSTLCAQVCTTHWNFLVAYGYCTCSSYWVTGLG
jgi:hypothetical protein